MRGYKNNIRKGVAIKSPIEIVEDRIAVLRVEHMLLEELLARAIADSTESLSSTHKEEARLTAGF